MQGGQIACELTGGFTVQKFKSLALISFCTTTGLLMMMSVRWQGTRVHAQAPTPSMLVPNLAVRTVVSGLNQPTSMAFLDENRFFVLEKATGKVKLVNGAVSDIANLQAHLLC